jgi:hypothetical protein
MLAGDIVECAIEHADDVRRLVVDDGAGLLVPQHRHTDAPGVLRISQCIKLVDELCAGDWIGLLESLSAFQHERIDHTDRHDSLKPFEGVKNHGAVAPGHGKAT